MFDHHLTLFLFFFFFFYQNNTSCFINYQLYHQFSGPRAQSTGSETLGLKCWIIKGTFTITRSQRMYYFTSIILTIMVLNTSSLQVQRYGGVFVDHSTTFDSVSRKCLETLDWFWIIPFSSCFFLRRCNVILSRHYNIKQMVWEEGSSLRPSTVERQHHVQRPRSPWLCLEKEFLNGNTQKWTDLRGTSLERSWIETKGVESHKGPDLTEGPNTNGFRKLTSS